jgi:hypothetical protein
LLDRIRSWCAGKLYENDPQLETAKQLVSLRLDPRVIAYYKKRGPGWQTRINDVLCKAARLPQPANGRRSRRKGQGGSQGSEIALPGPTRARAPGQDDE